MKKHHFTNMYLTVTLSVAIVLALVGAEAAVLLSAHQLIKQIKEKVVLMVLLDEQTTNEDCKHIEKYLNNNKYCKSCTYISKEDALKEHIEKLGEDPTEFLGYNPLLASYEINLKAEYAQADSIAKIEERLNAFPFVRQVQYQRDLVKILDKNVNYISFGIGLSAIVLLLVSLSLIVSSIRLQVYSQRFLINTMKLVGAKPWNIKGPIVKKNVYVGLIASVLALLVLSLGLYFCYRRFSILFFAPTWENIVFITAVVVVSGVLITFLASVFAVNKYIRMRTDKFFYV